MFSTCAIRASILLAIASAFLHSLASDSSAQQRGQSLFVIKAPAVKQIGYGEKPNVIRIAQVSEQKEAISPSEDLDADNSITEKPKGFDPLEELIDLDDDLDDLDAEEDELMEEDDVDETPPATPMTTWNLKPMSSIVAGIRPPAGRSPVDQSWQLSSRQSIPNAHAPKIFAWAAPDIRYNPLYFEDVALERYGQTRGFVRQPLASSFHFLKSATFLPYYSLYDPVNNCDGPLGYCRPGTSVNCVKTKHYFGNPFCGCR